MCCAFDNRAPHLELTMVHEAMILEYSGTRLALMEWASATKLLVFIVVFITLFLPWVTPAATTLLGTTGLLVGVDILVFEVFLVAIVIALIESTMAKFRIFRVPDLLFTSFILSAIAILLIVI